MSNTYEVVQLKGSTHGVQDPPIQFPKVLLECIAEDANHKDIPFGIPARVVPLNAMTSSPDLPTGPDQYYYNTATHKVVPSNQAGTAWDTGNAMDPIAGVLYRLRQAGSGVDTLYVKSIAEDALDLEPLVINHMQPTDTVIQTYQGPFAVSYTQGTGNVCNCTVAAGLVFRGSNRIYPIDANLSVTAVPNGESLYMRLQDRDEGPDDPLRVTYTTAQADETAQFRVRLAYNNNGTMVQCQWGDVYTDSITT